MSDVKGKTPDGWDICAHNKWLSGDENGAIQKALATINTYQGKKPRGVMLQLAYYLFIIEDFQASYKVLSEGHKSFPDDVEVLQNLVVVLGRLRKYKEAVNYGEKLFNLSPNNFVVCDSLAANLAQLGDYKSASDFGTKSLELKDLKYGKAENNWSCPSISPHDFVNKKKKVIAFSLWGGEPKYVYGAIRNLLLAPDIYPGWELWFYVDGTVPSKFLSVIEELGGKVIQQPDNQSTRQKLCWRFAVANEESIGYFLVRDVDSVISVREFNAVQEWLESGKYFHIIRDWWTHTDLILAGLWGGVAGVLPNISQFLANYRPENVETANVDQWFLRDVVWRYIKQSCYIHDRCFSYLNSEHLPGPLLENFHVGCCEWALRPNFQEKMILPWIKK